jgi:hypothetical protein
MGMCRQILVKLLNITFNENPFSISGVTAIYYLDFIHRPYVLQPQRFKGWFFPQVKELASIDRPDPTE